MNVTVDERVKQFLLSLLNATLLLGIIFVVAAIILITKIETFTASIISQAKFAALESIDKDVRDVAASISKTEQDLKDIAGRLNQLVDKPQIMLSSDLRNDLHALREALQSLQKTAAALPEATVRSLSQRLDKLVATEALPVSADSQNELRMLNRKLAAMQRTLSKLTSSHTALSDHAIRTIAAETANAYIELRGCRAASTSFRRKSSIAHTETTRSG